LEDDRLQPQAGMPLSGFDTSEFRMSRADDAETSRRNNIDHRLRNWNNR
jgi:hypothetical protein